MNTMLTILLCVVLGSVAAIFWPRRNGQEARIFAMTTLFAAAVIAFVNAWKRSVKR